MRITKETLRQHTKAKTLLKYLQGAGLNIRSLDDCDIIGIDGSDVCEVTSNVVEEDLSMSSKMKAAAQHQDPTITADTVPDFDAMTKNQLREFAAEHLDDVYFKDQARKPTILKRIKKLWASR